MPSEESAGAAGPAPADLDAQREHWESAFSRRREMFGAQASEAARQAAALFRKERVGRLLELGAGQGRDTLLFARAGFRTFALDYARAGLEALAEKARSEGMGARVLPVCHDVRTPLPFPAGVFDAAFSHMLYCMALTRDDLRRLAREVWRVVRPGGRIVYTVRHTGDPHCGRGTALGESLYQLEGFVVHYFSRELVDELGEGCVLEECEPFEEGALPRKLWRVVQRRL